jgi:hypothetical protein
MEPVGAGGRRAGSVMVSAMRKAVVEVAVTLLLSTAQILCGQTAASPYTASFLLH